MMMLGQQDSQFLSPRLSPEKSTTHRRFGSSLSLATTADEDSLTASPKRWADISDEDEDLDLFMLDRSPSFADRREEEAPAPDSTFGCAAQAWEASKQYAGNETLSPWGGGAHGGGKGQPGFVGGDAHANFGRHRDGKHGRPTGCPSRAQPASVLPPSSQRHAWTGSCAVDALQAEGDASRSAASHDFYTVTLTGVPGKLCNDACLDAILWVAGVHGSALGTHLKKNGHVEINFDTYEAAMACQSHFKACAWASGKLKVEIALPGSQQAGFCRLIRQEKKASKHSAGFSHRPANGRSSLSQQGW